MLPRITVTIVPRHQETDILVTEGSREVMKARLGASWKRHRYAMRTLLEGIALWYQERVRVVLSADSEPISCDLGLSDGLGLGIDTIHYTVEIVRPRERGRRAKYLHGVGDFREARRQLHLVWSQS